MLTLSPLLRQGEHPIVFNSLHELGQAIRAARSQPSQVPAKWGHLLQTDVSHPDLCDHGIVDD